MSASFARTAAVAMLPVSLAVLAVLASAAGAQDAGEVTIYRCTAANGQVVIGNVPCADGATQQVRSMVRPVDGTPPPAALPEAAPTPAPAPQPEVRYVVAQPAQPLYECTRPDGSVYESDSGQGEVRWVPLWTSGWPAGGGWRGGGPHGSRPGHSGGGGRGDIGARGTTTRAGDGLSAPPVSRISIPPDPPRPDPGATIGPRPPHRGGGWVGAEPGNWEPDPCHVLPQTETCARLRDRREVVRRRFFNAQQVERDTLRVEERGLNARIDRDCR